MEEREREKIAFGPAFVPKEDLSEEKAAANKAAVEQISLQEGAGEQMMPREHPSDIKGDVKSLDRKGSRNIYLLLQVKEGEKEVWRFPQGNVEKGELLHQVAFLRLSNLVRKLILFT